jgi:hypothetical protein
LAITPPECPGLVGQSDVLGGCIAALGRFEQLGEGEAG